jgi:type IV fimbrial biogenesis protein FimT
MPAFATLPRVQLMKNPRRGFTLIELMITLALAGLLLTLAAPAFNTFVASSRVMEQTNELVAALSFARSESVKRNATIFVCRAESETATDCAGDGTWRNFMITTAVTAGTIIRRGTLDGFGNTHFVQSSLMNERVAFGSDGFARNGSSTGALLTGESFTVCSTRYSKENIRRLTLGAGSRISTTRESGTCS